MTYEACRWNSALEIEIEIFSQFKHIGNFVTLDESSVKFLDIISLKFKKHFQMKLNRFPLSKRQL